MSEYVIMPTADYQAACDTIRAATGKSDPIKSGDLAGEIGAAIDRANVEGVQMSGDLLKYAAYAVDPENKTLTIYAILWSELYADTGSYDIHIPSKLGELQVILASEGAK